MLLKTFHRGVHPSYHKELTRDKPIEPAAIPGRVVIPLWQHTGSPCEPTVKKGEDVTEGQKIGDAKSFVSSPVHASITGKVKDITMHPHPGGAKVLSVIIDGDGRGTHPQDGSGVEKKDWNKDSDGVALEKLTPEEIRSIVRDAGIVGLGGATFPTSVKLTPPKGILVDTVILNGCECEPYLTADHRVMLESPDKVVWGLKAIMKAVGAARGVIGIEDNKEGCAMILSKAASSILPELKVVLLKTKYPQGAEKMLIHALMGRKVPAGKLPFDVGVVVNNVATAAAITEAIRYKKPLIERVVTVSGNGVRTPKNLRVRLGVSFAEVLIQCGGLVQEGEKEILAGGPMMGIAQKDLDVPVVKGTSGITVLRGGEIKPLRYEPCIRCASCVEACPMGLMPYRIGDMGRLGMTGPFKSWSGSACIECGCCSFVCPSKRPLVQWIRVGKMKLRSSSGASGA
ncbi:MAG: electron transport complex subunit RsxC [Deltaproteobacteria bacterium]|nr:electron transport complex subunit RsxC [Deltaproteobacteria bacterium]